MTPDSPTLFEAGPTSGTHRAADPATSVEAARSVDVPARQQEVLDALEALGGEGICDEIVAWLAARGLARYPNTVGRRLTDLSRWSPPMVAKTGAVRAASSGRNQQVWVRLR